MPRNKTNRIRRFRLYASAQRTRNIEAKRKLLSVSRLEACRTMRHLRRRSADTAHCEEAVCYRTHVGVALCSCCIVATLLWELQ